MTILTIVIILIATSVLIVISEKIEPLSLNFSDINMSIAEGNPISWAGIKNQPGDKRPQYNQNPNLVFQGHNFPLARETYQPLKGENTLVTHKMKCSPDCCPSPYSCDHGCLCYQYDQHCFRYNFP